MHACITCDKILSEYTTIHEFKDFEMFLLLAMRFMKKDQFNRSLMYLTQREELSDLSLRKTLICTQGGSGMMHG